MALLCNRRNAVHQVEQKLCKWLLRMYDLVVIITQEFMAQMMGVRRTSVTTIASNLQKSGMISYTRGKVRIKNLAALKARSCECHEELSGHFKPLFGLDPEQ